MGFRGSGGEDVARLVDEARSLHESVAEGREEGELLARGELEQEREAHEDDGREGNDVQIVVVQVGDHGRVQDDARSRDGAEDARVVQHEKGDEMADDDDHGDPGVDLVPVGVAQLLAACALLDD